MGVFFVVGWVIGVGVWFKLVMFMGVLVNRFCYNGVKMCYECFLI